MPSINISDLLRRPEPRVTVTPVQFLRVFETVWKEELDRTGMLADDSVSLQRVMNFNERSSQLQFWQKMEGGEKVEFQMVATVDAQIIPQRNALNAINYSLWYLPTNNQSRFLSILEELDAISGEAARAVMVMNTMFDDSYKPTEQISQLAETSKKSQRGVSVAHDLVSAAKRGGGAATTNAAADMLGLK